MRDDAASIVAELVRIHDTKLRLLNTLLLSESDKLHYARTGNLEKVIEIIGADAGVMDEIDAADFDMAEAESRLASLLGARRAALYEVLRGSGEAGELASARERVVSAMKDLYARRGELTRALEAASGGIGKDIDDLSRICRLREGGADGHPHRG